MLLEALLILVENEARIKFVKDRYVKKIVAFFSDGDTDFELNPESFYVRNAEGTIEDFANADPSRKKIYLEWIVKQYLKDARTAEDTDAIAQDLAIFDAVKNQLPADKRDINKYDRRTLQAAMREYGGSKSNNQIKKDELEELKKHITVVYDGPQGKVYVPKTKEASCFLGRGTRWCTAAKNNNQFSNYHRHGDLYVMITPKGEKFQFWVVKNSGHLEAFEHVQLMDDQDELVHPYSHETSIQHIENLFTHIKKELNRDQQILSAALGATCGVDMGDLMSFWKTMSKSERDMWLETAMDTEETSRDDVAQAIAEVIINIDKAFN